MVPPITPAEVQSILKLIDKSRTSRPKTQSALFNNFKSIAKQDENKAKQWIDYLVEHQYIQIKDEKIVYLKG